MRSLNPEWHWQEFHNQLARMSGASIGDTVLDLGCGRGATVPHLLRCVGPSGKVVALDRRREWLSEISERHAQAILDGQLEVHAVDLSDGLPYDVSTFDAIVCQNVFEGLRNPASVIAQAIEALKFGGSMIIGHHDFDGVIVASSYRDLTRRIVHGYADCSLEWQDLSDGQTGRLLPSLFHCVGLSRPVTETVLFVDLSLSAESFAQSYIEWVYHSAYKFGIETSDMDRWKQDLINRSNQGSFYFAVPWVYVLGARGAAEVIA